jgi:hypothetical protein
VISLLKKSGVALFVLALALVAQIPHAAHVFDRAPYLGATVQPDSAAGAWLLAYAYAIALESATLMFVVHGHQRASYGFALASFAVNLSYYAMHGVNLWAWSNFPAWLLAALLPIAIASYSHILTGAQDTVMRWPQWAARAWAKMRQDAPAQRAKPTVQPVAEPVQPVMPIVQPPMQPDNEEQPDPQRLAAQLRDEGLTNLQIGDRLGVHRNTVGKWLNGASKVSA